MSDDTRSSATKQPRKTRPRILVVNNPSPDSGPSSDDERAEQSQVQPTPFNFRSRPLPSPRPTPVDKQQGPSAPHLPPPLTTNIPDQRHCYSSSRSNPSNPTLSSPSSVSSPAFESTPPPSTPGLSAPTDDLSGEGTIRQDTVVLSPPDRSDAAPSSASRSAKMLANIIPRLGGHGRRSSNDRRPPSSPTTTPDTYTPANPVYNSDLAKVTLLVTSDADSFSTVDITGALTSAFIRERIFSKLRISDDDQSYYSIYLTEIGKYAIGDALTDEQLFDLYRRQGDDRGSLKLLVSSSSASVHEPIPDRPIGSPTVNSIPPPVLPQHGLVAPLRPVRRRSSRSPRSRSRATSHSSASERLPQEGGTGYEASVSDDLDHVDRSTMRPLPPHIPQRAPSPVTVTRRPRSPPAVVSPENMTAQGSSGSPTMRPDAQRAAIAPMSSSPQKGQYAEHPSRWNSPSTISSDGTIGDRFTPVSESRVDSPERSRRTPYEEGGRSEQSPWRRKPPVRKDSGSRRGKNHEGSDGWTFVQSDIPSSEYKTKRDRPITPQDARSPTRYPPQTKFVPLLSHPPRAPTSGGSGDSRHSKRQAGQAVPFNWAVSYKEPGKIEQKSPPGSSIRMFPTKSFNDLRSTYKTHQPHPPALTPGRTQQRVMQPPLPVSNRPSTGSSATSSSAISHTASSTSDVSATSVDPRTEGGIARSYEPQRSIVSPAAYTARPGATTGYISGNLAGTGLLGLSSPPGTEPIPRPRSAVDDRATPELRPRLYQPPRGSEHTQDVGSSRPLHSPPHFPVSGSIASQGSLIREDAVHISRPPLHVEHMDTPISSSPSNLLRRGPRSPPRSPIASVPSQYPPRDQDARPDGSPWTSTRIPPPPPLPPVEHTVMEDPGPSEPTLRRDERAFFTRVIDENAIEGTMMPKAPASRAYLPTPLSSMPSASSASATLIGTAVPDLDDESESDNDLWAIPPDAIKSKNSRPPLTLSIDGPPSSETVSQANGRHDMSKTPPVSFPAPPNYIPEPPSVRGQKRPHVASGASQRGQDVRTSRFQDGLDFTWAPRPPPEDVYDRLEEYFPEHDLDRPVIDVSSGGSSPTSAENPAVVSHKYRHKRSIRHVAEEHKKTASRMEFQAPLRKRNTKLWGSKLEEVTTQQARAELSSVTQDSSPGGAAKPIFRWVRGELIGKGTYGKVYLALNATTGEMIAVKQVEMPRTASDKSDTRQVTVVEALKLESETLKDLDHPNIVQYLGFEETPTFLSIFLEYVPGGSIASCLRKHGKFDDEVSKSFTGQILDGLEYLHKRGILHRDLKADNILVETSGVCKISDFGISKRTDDINMAEAYTSMQGTVFWMAPEVINSQQRGYNSKIDIWSVGCVVYEMWTGQRPWSGQEAMAVLLHLYQTKQGPPLPSDVQLSSLADDFRQRCFAMDPDERPTAAVLRLHPYLELQPGWTFTGFK